jgi:glycerol dehydrogenase-like iron-containing ADH family enzyme
LADLAVVVAGAVVFLAVMRILAGGIGGVIGEWLACQVVEPRHCTSAVGDAGRAGWRNTACNAAGRAG